MAGIACVSSYINVKLVQTPNGGSAQVPEGPPLDIQYVDFSGGAAQTANALDPKARFYRVNVDSICARKVAASAAPGSVTDGERMSAEQTEYLGLPANHGASTDSTKVAYKVGFITRT
jgi:hypothetical protein